MPNKLQLLKYIGVFLLFFSFFLAIQLSIDGFIGFDPYYHAKHSDLIADKQVLTLIEPWVEFHFLSSAPNDPYWLYHLILAGFIKIFGIIWGMKILSAILASSVFLIFYYILHKEKLRQPFLFTLLFFFASSAFLFRLTIERPFVGSISLLLLLYYLLIKKEHCLAFMLTALYILFYNLAVLSFFLVAVIMIVVWLKKRKLILKPFIAIGGGMLTGLFLHPQTINYLNIIYTHFIQVLSFKLQGIALPSGQEINFNFSTDFFANNFLAVGLFILAVSAFLLIPRAKRTINLYSLLTISSIWFVLAICFPRGVEYWLPFSFLFISYTYTILVKAKVFNNLDAKIKEKFNNWLVKTALSLLLIILITANISNLFLVINNNFKNQDLAEYKKINDFLITQTEPNSIVWYPIWAMFPKMFYFNNHNRYVAAFDPIFTYKYNPEHYWIYYNIASAAQYCNHPLPCEELGTEQQKQAIRQAFKYQFGTKTILVPKTGIPTIYSFLQKQEQDYQQIFETKNLVIYQVQN